MSKVGFHSKWIGWDMECISTISYSLINAIHKGKFSHQEALGKEIPFLLIFSFYVSSFWVEN